MALGTKEVTTSLSVLGAVLPSLFQFDPIMQAPGFRFTHCDEGQSPLFDPIHEREIDNLLRRSRAIISL
jgi:hypothetical protein